MKQNEKIQTRKDEVRFKTSDIRRIIGKYLATNVLRTWNRTLWTMIRERL